MNQPNPYTGLAGQTSNVPEFVTLDELPDVDSSKLTLGIGVDGPVTVDLDSESPHILVNAPTGKGKSTVARSLAVQSLARGDLVVFLDRKMHSHMWARPLSPLVHYADTAESIGSALVNLGRELHRRNQVVKTGEGVIGPRIVLIFEETNATLSQLKILDKQNGDGYGALNAFEDVSFMGRAVRIHIVAFAQLASYRSGLTADLLENFGTKVLINHSPTAWKWLASDCGRNRSAPAQVGRGLVCYAGKATEVQMAHIAEDEATEAVLSSIPAQRQVRRMVSNRSAIPPVWRAAIAR